MRTGWKIVIGVVVVFLAFTGVGLAIDASDGSIDAMDDRKWEQTGGDGVRSPADAYDAGGWSFDSANFTYDFLDAEWNLPVCPVLQQGHDDFLTGELTAEEMQTFVDSANEGLLRVAEVSDWGEVSMFWVSGWWDEAARTCPDAFFEPTVVGRPLG